MVAVVVHSFACKTASRYFVSDAKQIHNEFGGGLTTTQSIKTSQMGTH